MAWPGERRIYSNAGFELLAELVAERARMSFSDYLRAAILEPLGLDSTRLDGSAAHGAAGPLIDLLAFGRALLAPRFVAAETLDWGLGFELKDAKSPHWTGERNSARTFGHFGRAGTFIWVDPDAGIALAVLTDLEFGDWAKEAWPALSDAVLAEISETR
jgi:CubicO group peptidase (beta-lactamase class C family)